MDNLQINARFRIRKDVVIHLVRKVQGNGGTIKVAVGQEVRPEDIIGEGQSVGGFRTIHLASELNLPPKEALKYLSRRIGQNIYQGELLATKKELFGLKRRLFFSPTDGIIDFYDDQKGDLRIKLFPRTLKLISGAFGIVDQVDKDSGSIIIRCLASLVYGVFGSGKERDGIIKVTGGKEMLISSKQISPSLENQIVVGGSVIFQDALEKAISSRVSGFITGGTNAADYKSMVGGQWNIYNKRWADVGLSLMVTEGFGSIPIGIDIFTILKEYDGRFAILNGNRARLILPSNNQNSMMYIRKTALPQGSFVESEPQLEVINLKVGAIVRIVGDPVMEKSLYPTQIGSFVGQQGTVLSIDQVVTVLPSGVKTYLVALEGKQQKLRVPYLNLEVIV